MDGSSTPRYGDECLSTWVDGEGSAGERAAIAAWLQAHPDEAARVEAWKADREALQAAFAAVVHEPVPARLRAVVEGTAAEASSPAATVASPSGPARPARPTRRDGPDDPDGAGRPAIALLPLAWPRWGLAAAAVSLFVLGGATGVALGWQWHERQTLAAGRAAALTAAAAPQGWLRRAAFAHSVYTPEPRHAVEVKAQEEHLARWLTRRIEAPVKLFDLRPMGFELVGGRLLPDGPGKSAQLMYQNAEGARVTVYLRKPEPGTDTAFRWEQQGKLGMFYWVDEKTGFALVGELPKERLLAMARSIHDQDATLPAPSLVVPGAASAAAAAASR